MVLYKLHLNCLHHLYVFLWQYFSHLLEKRDTPLCVLTNTQPFLALLILAIEHSTMCCNTPVKTDTQEHFCLGEL